MTSIADMGRDLSALWQQRNELDQRWLFRRHNILLNRQIQCVQDRITALETMAGEVPPASLQDLLALLIVAHGNVDPGVKYSPEHQDRITRWLDSMLYAAIEYLERETAESRETFAGEYYTPKRLDPRPMAGVS